MAKGKRKSKLEKLKEATQKLENVMKPLQTTMDAVDKLAFHLPTLGMAFIGWSHHHRDAPWQMKAFDAIRGALAVKLASSSNLAGSILGTGMIGELTAKFIIRYNQPPPYVQPDREPNESSEHYAWRSLRAQKLNEYPLSGFGIQAPESWLHYWGAALSQEPPFESAVIPSGEYPWQFP